MTADTDEQEEYIETTYLDDIKVGDTVRINGQREYEVVDAGAGILPNRGVSKFALELDTNGDKFLLIDEGPNGHDEDPFLTDGKTMWGHHVTVEKRGGIA
jgi:hypothetical protein